MPRGIARYFLLSLLILITGCTDSKFGRRSNVLEARGEATLQVMDFTQAFSITPLPPGWFHRTFWRHGPMQMDIVTKAGTQAIRLRTNDSASMLFRHVDIRLDNYPSLSWDWFIEEPIASSLDESTRQGDDHPARLFLVFQTDTGQRRAMEIIWGNKLMAGQYKYINGFAHYVARGGDNNSGRWWHERVALLAIYRTIWPDATPCRVVEIALFCDSDDTNTHSVSYFAQVSMHQATP